LARPNLSYLKHVILAIFGFPTGVVTGMTGMGNSVFLLPLQRWLLGLKGHALSGTTLVIMTFTALSSLLAYIQYGAVHWLLGIVFDIGSILGVVAGTRIAAHSGARLSKLRPFWALLAVAIGTVMLMQGYHVRQVAHLWLAMPIHHPNDLAAGLLSGVLVGLVGRISDLGGVLSVPCLIYFVRLSPIDAQGTALFCVLLASLPTAIIYSTRNAVEPTSSVGMSVGAVFGGLIGSRAACSGMLSPNALLSVYGIVLVAIGLSVVPRKAELQPQHKDT
jgi:hypothetical protein